MTNPILINPSFFEKSGWENKLKVSKVFYIKTKNFKNHILVLAIVNYWIWIDASPPLKVGIG